MTTPPQEPPPAQPQPQPGPPVQKSKAAPVIIIILAVVLVVCLGCAGGAYYFWFRAAKTVEDVVNNLPSNFPTNGAQAPQNNNHTTHALRLEVNGSGQAQIIWAGTVGEDTQHVDLPWSKDFPNASAPIGITLVVAPDDGNNGVQNCRILVDGAEKNKVDASSGQLQCVYQSVN